jgi:hypothetical protein
MHNNAHQITCIINEHAKEYEFHTYQAPRSFNTYTYTHDYDTRGDALQSVSTRIVILVIVHIIIDFFHIPFPIPLIITYN